MNILKTTVFLILSFFSFSVMAEGKVLMVLTSHAEMGDSGKRTGFWLAELTHPYYVLKDKGFEVDIASIKGGPAPIDPRSIEEDDAQNQRFLNDAFAMRQVLTTPALSAMNADAYDAIVFSGGHGTMWDFPANPVVNSVTAKIYQQGGVVAAVCHGPAALVDVKLDDGRYLVEGKRVAAFTNEEEMLAELDTVVPFLLESKVKEIGAEHVYAEAWTKNVVVDGRLVTGQNPQSASLLGEKVAELLAK